MVSLSELRTMMDDARALSDDLGIVTRDLTEKELGRFGRSFTRQFIRALPTRQMVDIHIRHQKEALLGAMIAKEQMDAEIDDEIPASNKVGGPIPIRACFLGVGDDWEDLNGILNNYAGAPDAWPTGVVVPWIHAGTILLGNIAASQGLPIRVGENAVHVIYGCSSIHAAPKLESIRFTIDGKQKPMMYCGWAQKHAVGHTQRIKEFDNAFILKKDTTFLAEVFFSSAYGAPVEFITDFPVLYGVSFCKEPALRVLDPGAVAWEGTRFEIVHRT